MHKGPINFAGMQNSVHVGHDVADPIWSTVCKLDQLNQICV